MTEERKARLEEELTLLQKTKWGWKDIMAFYQVASAKANAIRKRVVGLKGTAPYDEHKVLVKDILEVEDATTPETEITKRRIELEGVIPGVGKTQEEER